MSKNRFYKCSSGFFIPEEVWENTDLTLYEKVTLVAIENTSKEKRRINEGLSTNYDEIAEFLNITKVRAKRVCESLAKKGYLSVFTLPEIRRADNE